MMSGISAAGLKPVSVKHEHTRHTDGVLVFCGLRNEMLRLPYFFEYCRHLGVSGFVVAENDSTDGSLEWLLAQPDCSVFTTTQSYSRSNYGIDWLNALLGTFALDQWALVLDADELLVYPQCETKSLDQLILDLDGCDCNAFPTFLLDMYAPGPIQRANYQPPAPFTEVCDYFDEGSYTLGPDGPYKGIPIRGGVRERLFWSTKSPRSNSPFLGKCPLLKWQQEMRLLASTHTVAGIRPSQMSGALLHFKLFSDFYDHAQSEAARAEHWDEGGQYQAYWDVLAANPELDPMYSGSRRYQCSDDLLKLGLMRVPTKANTWQA